MSRGVDRNRQQGAPEQRKGELEEKRGDGKRAGETPCTEKELIIIIIINNNNNSKSIALAAT